MYFNIIKKARFDHVKRNKLFKDMPTCQPPDIYNFFIDTLLKHFMPTNKGWSGS